MWPIPVLAQAAGTWEERALATPGQEALHFDVATVKPSDPHFPGYQMEFTVNGFVARRMPLREMIKEAYGTYEENRIVGGAAWLKTSEFDVNAKIVEAQTTRLRDLSINQRRAMLEELLKDRFKLATHRESRDLPVYLLVVGKNGPRLKETDPKGTFQGSIKGMDSLVTRSNTGLLEGKNFAADGIAGLLAGRLRRIVLNRTGLVGRYDFTLQWTPDDPAVSRTASDTGADASAPVWPSLFTALQEQLGLKLEPAKASVQVIVVDHAEMPAEN